MTTDIENYQPGMLDLVFYPDKRLNKKCILVKNFDSELKQLIADMWLTMQANKGVGISAPQVGKNVRVLIVQVSEPIVMINPYITYRSTEMISIQEGCLSFPGYFQEIPRHQEIQVLYVDENNQQRQLKATDLTSIAIQHELDHLDGKLLPDHLKFTQRLKFKATYRNLIGLKKSTGGSSGQ